MTNSLTQDPPPPQHPTLVERALAAAAKVAEQAKADPSKLKKANSGKRRMDLIAWRTIEALADVVTYGAIKYTRPDFDASWSWVTVPDARDAYFAALMRHLTAWRRGELVDEESGLPHLALAMCNVMFLLAFELGDTNGVVPLDPKARPAPGP